MPKLVQPELIAINALNVELAQIRDKVDTRKSDTSALYRLQFWKDAISSIYGLSPLPVPRQPVAIALCVCASTARSDLLLKLVEARQSTIGDRQFENIDALANYGKSTTGSLLSLQLDALGKFKNVTIFPQAYDVANNIGASYAIANLIRSTHPLLARGIVLLPNDVMLLNSATPDSVYKKKNIEATQGVVQDLVKESKKYLSNARSHMDSVPKMVRQALFASAASTDYIIKNVEKYNYDIYSPHLQRRNPLLLWTLLVRKFRGIF